MKRTKETFYKEHPHFAEREGVSGCKEFDGEDLQYDSRLKFLKSQQKDWLKQQMREKQERKDKEKAEEMSYASQTLEMNRMRGMLNDDFFSRKTDIKHSVKDDNLLMALQKKEKEKQEKMNRITEEKGEVDVLKERGKKRIFP